MCVTNHLVRHISKNKTLYVYKYIFQHSNWRTTVLSFSVCTFLSPHNTHFFYAKHLLSSVHAVGPHFFTKAPSFQGSSMALKKNIVYKGCSPSIGCASGITPFFEGKERQQVKEQNKQKMKNTEHKGKGQEGKKKQKRKYNKTKQ